MSRNSYLQIIKVQNVKVQKAVSEYVALAELDRTVKTQADRDAWEELWQEFLHSDKWTLAIAFVKECGI